MRQGIGGAAALLQPPADEQQASVKFHTAIFPSVAALKSSLYLRKRGDVGRNYISFLFLFYLLRSDLFHKGDLVIQATAQVHEIMTK